MSVDVGCTCFISSGSDLVVLIKSDISGITIDALVSTDSVVVIAGITSAFSLLSTGFISAEVLFSGTWYSGPESLVEFSSVPPTEVGSLATDSIGSDGIGIGAESASASIVFLTGFGLFFFCRL